MPNEVTYRLTPNEVMAVMTAELALRGVYLGLDPSKLAAYTPLFQAMFSRLSAVYVARLNQPDLPFGDR